MIMQPTLGEKLREMRELTELTQAELGLQLRMTQRKLSYLETDKREPNIDDLRAICTFFNISANYLLNLPADLYHPTTASRHRHSKS